MIHARNFAAGRVPGAVLVGVADPADGARHKACRELGLKRDYADYRRALEDPAVDSVVVASPTIYHRDIVAVAVSLILSY